MLPLIQFFVFILVVPLIYIAIIIFDLLLILRSRTLIQRYQTVGGVIAGFLISVMIILLDQASGGLIKPSQEINQLENVWQYSVIMALLGFILLFIIDLIIRRGGNAFIELFTILGVIVSAYYLITLTQIRTVTAICSIGFLVGTIIYFIMFPNRFFHHLAGKSNQVENDL